jgi:hypothetical protein
MDRMTMTARSVVSIFEGKSDPKREKTVIGWWNR